MAAPEALKPISTDDPGESVPFSALFCPAILVVATAVALWPLLSCKFVYWDDQLTVWQNPHFNSPSLCGLLRYWTWPSWGLYMPLTCTVWFLIALVTPRDEAAAEPFQ